MPQLLQQIEQLKTVGINLQILLVDLIAIEEYNQSLSGMTQVAMR